MPRKSELVAESYAELAPSRGYPVRVLRVEVRRKQGEIHATFTHCSQEQEGRQQTCVLPARLLPNNLTTQFLRAAGLDVTVGEKVCPSDAVGTVVLVAFSPSAAGKAPEPVSFSPLKEKADDEHVE